MLFAEKHLEIAKRVNVPLLPRVCAAFYQDTLPSSVQVVNCRIEPLHFLFVTCLNVKLCAHVKFC